jgi:hypothetical protein
MMNAAATDADATNLNANTAFSDIKWDEGTQWNNVYCSTAKENFRAGESVELDPPIQITGTNYYSQVGAILRVDQQCDQQRVLLSLFLDVTPDMGIRHDPPDDQVYTQYPEKQVVWTRYQGWYPVTRVRREAYVVTPWEVSAGLNDTQITYGMSNAYCVVAKWQHEVLHPARAFCPLGHQKIVIPGCLHSAVTFESVTQRYWFFRSSVAVKIADVLSKGSLAASTKGTIQLHSITPSHWDHLKKWTIPLENTERKGIVTTKTIRKNLVVEMIKDEKSKQFARFDTVPRFDLLKAYFGSGIQAAGRIRRFAGPKFSRRTGPVPAFRARRLLNDHSIGIISELCQEPTQNRYSTKPGIDLTYCMAKRQLTIYIRYLVKHVTDRLVHQHLPGLLPPPQLPLNNGVPQQVGVQVALEVDESQFELDDTVYIVRDFTDNGDEVVCEVLESSNDAIDEGGMVNFPVGVVQQAVMDYLS